MKTDIRKLFYDFEEWRPVIYKDIKKIYEVSNYGRVRNINTGKVLKSFNCHKETDHLSISLMKRKRQRKSYRSSDKRRSVYVHQLVANAFVPNPDNKLIVHHIDGNPDNNFSSNLMWVTASEHQVLTYLLEQRDRKFGEKCSNAKYTTAQYLHLAKLMEEDELTIPEMANKTGISVAMVREFVNGRTIWPDARNAYNVSKYSKKQVISVNEMEHAFQLASTGEYSVIDVSRMTGVKPTTVSNIFNHSISNKWKYLYDRYSIPKFNRGKNIIVISDTVTDKIISALKTGKTPIDIINDMDLPKNKSIYGKIYRLSRKYQK